MMIFVNLPVTDLARSKAFFAALGFGFNAKFTDDKAACMIVNDQACVMLLAQPFFQTFTKRKVADESVSEALICVSADSREAVDAMVKTAVSSGGSHAMPVQDMGFMYGHSFYDPDGHHWEVMWMAPQQ